MIWWPLFCRKNSVEISVHNLCILYRRFGICRYNGLYGLLVKYIKWWLYRYLYISKFDIYFDLEYNYHKANYAQMTVRWLMWLK